MDAVQVPSRNWWRWWPFAAKWLLVLGVAGYAIYAWKLAPLQVSTATAEKSPLVSTVMGTGTLEARVKAIISPKIAGRIAEVLVDQGDEVKQGDLLLRLDDEDLRQQVLIAQATLSATEASVGRFTADRQQAESVLAQTKLELDRDEQLLPTNSISQSEFDQARQDYQVAQAGLARAQAGLLEVAEQVRLAQETLRYQEARLADTQVVAPFDGLVIERLRDPGAVAVPGSAILSVISLEELWVSAWVDETEMESLAPGQSALVAFRSNPNATCPGVVARLGKQADRETREFLVDVRVTSLPPQWAVGQRAEVYIETAQVNDAVVIPATHVFRHEGSPSVYVANTNGIAEVRAVELGIDDRQRVQVLAGLEVGERVLLPPLRGQDISGRRIALP